MGELSCEPHEVLQLVRCYRLFENPKLPGIWEKDSIGVEGGGGRITTLLVRDINLQIQPVIIMK